MGSNEELYITKVSRVLLEQSLKISVVVTTTRNIEKCNRKSK